MPESASQGAREMPPARWPTDALDQGAEGRQPVVEVCRHVEVAGPEVEDRLVAMTVEPVNDNDTARPQDAVKAGEDVRRVADEE